MRVLTALFVLFAFPLVAQPRTIGPLRPVSVARTGVATSNSLFLMHAAWNGSEHLFVWYDYRGHSDAEPGRAFAHGQALRIGAGGSTRQAITLPHRFIPVPGAVWANDQWIVVGTYSGGTCVETFSCVGGVRISGDGVLLDEQAKRIANIGGIFSGLEPSQIAWTGSHVVFGTRDSSFRPYAVFMNGALEITSQHQLATSGGGFSGIGSDGQTAMVVYRTNEETRAAVFDTEGRPLRNGRLLADGATVFGSVFSAAGGRYVLAQVVSDGPFGFMRIDAHHVSPDLALAALGSSAFTAINGYNGQSLAPQIVWDGTRYSIFTSVGDQQQPQPVVVAQFTRDGQSLTPSAVHLLDIPGVIGAGSLSVSGGPGSILFADAERVGNLKHVLHARVAPSIEAIPSAARQRLELGAFQQELPAAASGAAQSLIAWQERTTPDGPHAVFATRLDARGGVIDEDSLLLGDSSCARAFGVASGGDGFLVAWHDENAIEAVRVGANGSIAAQSSTGRNGSCADTSALRLAGNGTDYLAVWTVKRAATFYDVYAARLRDDGATLAPAFIRIGDSLTPDVHVASDGLDYLVAWDNEATRVTASGSVLDASISLFLGPGRVQFLWWNGTAYVAAVIQDAETGRNGVLEGGEWRFARVTSGGNVTRTSTPLQFPQLGTFAMPFAAACDATGCTLPVSTTHDRVFGLTLLRLEDDGTSITASTTAVPNYAAPAPDPVEWPLPAGLLDAGRPLLAVQQMRTDAPSYGVHRVFVTTFGIPKSRSVRH